LDFYGYPCIDLLWILDPRQSYDFQISLTFLDRLPIFFLDPFFSAEGLNFLKFTAYFKKVYPKGGVKAEERGAVLKKPEQFYRF